MLFLLVLYSSHIKSMQYHLPCLHSEIYFSSICETLNLILLVFCVFLKKARQFNWSQKVPRLMFEVSKMSDASFYLCRYEVCICSGKKVETIESGLLEQLLLHSTSVQNLNSKRLNASFKIHLPNANSGAAWFTKSILTRSSSSCCSLLFACR